MKAATLIILLLSNQGYWLSNQTGTISVQWTATSGMPAADLNWQLMIGALPLASGQVAMPTDDKPATISIKCPQVRVRTNVRVVHRVVQRNGQKELEHGEVALNLFPADLTQGWADQLRDKQLVVLDAADRLPKLLDAAKVSYTRVEDASRIDRADVILVGEDQIDDSTFGQSALITLAQQGRSVMFFRQGKPPLLGGYPVVARPMPAKLAWKVDHPLFAGFNEADLQSWLSGGTSLNAIELPADEPALELAYWPRQTPGKKPAPIEAAVFVKSIGTGRVIICELSMGDWEHDPRSQMLLGNALAYLLTPIQPTLRPSEREVAKTDAKDDKKSTTQTYSP